MPLSISRTVSLSQKGKAGRVASLREEPFPCISYAAKQAFDRTAMLSIAVPALDCGSGDVGLSTGYSYPAQQPLTSLATIASFKAGAVDTPRTK